MPTFELAQPQPFAVWLPPPPPLHITLHDGTAASAQEVQLALQAALERAQAARGGPARRGAAAARSPEAQDAHSAGPPEAAAALQHEPHAPHRRPATRGDPGRAPQEEHGEQPSVRPQRAAHARHVGQADEAVQEAQARRHRRGHPLPMTDLDDRKSNPTDNLLSAVDIIVHPRRHVDYCPYEKAKYTIN
ncbi:hypothetical protein ON010_g11305 [Phytophthora cinnamomi]|nr:hypothetical protein ON010_g11305 [Phytophthora cinnamomi]